MNNIFLLLIICNFIYRKESEWSIVYRAKQKKTKRDASSRGVSFRLLRVYENMFVYVLLIVAPLRSFPEQG